MEIKSALNAKFETIVMVVLILLGISVFLIWFLYNPVSSLKASIPGMDNRPLTSDNSDSLVIIGEKFKAYEPFSSILTGKWTRFRGQNFDNINKESIHLINNFGKDGPKIVWTVDLGEGHAAPVIYNGRVYLLDYDERKKSDLLHCYALETGKELWRRWYRVNVKRNHGMSRTIPAITDKYLITIGPRCHVMCTNPISGDLLWVLDIVKEYGTEIPLWYTGQCPLIDNDQLIIAPGGSTLIAAIDCETGKEIWRTPNLDKWKMSHSSIMPMTYMGFKMYVYCAIGGIVGVSAMPNDAGKVYWKNSLFTPNVLAPSPVIFDDGRFFITAGYGSGAAMFKLVKKDEVFSVKLIQKYKPSEGIASEQQTPILYMNRLFAIMPKDAGAARNQFVCCNPNDCKKILWTSDKSDRFGLGPYIIADGKFFILNDDGTLYIAKLSINEFDLLDKAKVIDGSDAWGPMALADGYLLLRDSKKMLCLNIKSK